MITHKPTLQRFINREQAKEILGKEEYYKATKNREFSFHSNREIILFEESCDIFNKFLG